jgi:hypothetical protein
VAKQKFNGATGIPLPHRAVRVLKDRGIFTHPLLSVVHQQLAQRYVLRGLESGGSAGDIGRYVTFARDDGQQLEYLHPVESIAVNGIHGVVISPELVRIDLLRKGRTYELLITRHSIGAAGKGSRPQLDTQILFRGVHGRLELDLHGKDKARSGSVVPSFFSLAGEAVEIPERLMAVVRAATKGANCAGCSHVHFLRKPGHVHHRPVENQRPHETSDEATTEGVGAGVSDLDEMVRT